MFTFLSKTSLSTKIDLTRLFTIKNTVFMGLCVLVLYRLSMLNQPYLHVFFDEAYYYHWSQHLSFGYYSKPPFVAWLISLTTGLFGVSNVAIKLASPLCYGLVALNVFWITRRLSNERAALYALIVFITTPLVGFNSLFITTDAPLFVWWSVSLLWALRFEQTPSFYNALVLGVALGCGMLSKYTFALLPIGLLIYLISCQRHLLRSRNLWLSIGIALVLFSLNVMWNVQHGFVAVKHTQEIAQLSGDLFDLASFLAFIGTQFIIFGVVYSIAIFSNYRRWVRQFTLIRHFYLILLVTLPILVVIGLQSLLSRAFANWAGPFMVGASILAGIALSRMQLRYLLVGAVLNLLLLSTFYHWPVILSAVGIEQTKRNSPFVRIAGWPELADKISHFAPNDANNVQLLSNSRELLAYVGYYNRWPFDQLLYWNSDNDNIRNHYDLKNNIRLRGDLENHRLLLVTKPHDADKILETFQNTAFLGVVETKVSGRVIRSAEVYEVQGFTGYEHHHERN